MRLTEKRYHLSNNIFTFPNTLCYLPTIDKVAFLFTVDETLISISESKENFQLTVIPKLQKP